jgi:hypothetical protein
MWALALPPLTVRKTNCTMDGSRDPTPPTAILPERGSTSSASASPLGSSSTPDLFSPEHHSWILVPDHVPEGPPAAGNSEGTHALTGVSRPSSVPPGELDESGVSHPSPPDRPSHLALHSPPPLHENAPAGAEASPALGESILKEGEAIAALAVSEILSNEWPTGPAPPPLTSSPLANSESAEQPFAFPSMLDGAEKPSHDDNEKSCDECSASEEEDFPYFDACFLPWIDFEIFTQSAFWRRPLTIAAVLIASHVAALVVGVAVGKHLQLCHTSAAAEADGVYLTRRFSSGAAGQHARLCNA